MADVTGDVLVPAVTLLVSSGIAIGLARGERRAAQRARYAEATRAAAQDVLKTLAHLIDVDTYQTPWEDWLRDFRASVNVFQMALPVESVQAATWLALEARYGAALLHKVNGDLRHDAGYEANRNYRMQRLAPVHEWAIFVADQLTNYVIAAKMQPRMVARTAWLRRELES